MRFFLGILVALVTLKHLLQKNVKCRNLLENDAGGGSVSGPIAVNPSCFCLNICEISLMHDELIMGTREPGLFSSCPVRNWKRKTEEEKS